MFFFPWEGTSQGPTIFFSMPRISLRSVKVQNDFVARLSAGPVWQVFPELCKDKKPSVSRFIFSTQTRPPNVFFSGNLVKFQQVG
jgi:hypothetical protein